MPINPEDNYEDSYLKEERLRQELQLAFAEANAFLKNSKNELKEIDELTTKMRNIEEDIEKSNKLEHDLKLELDKMKAKEETISDLDEKIDAAKNTFEQQSKVWQLWSEQDDLYKKLFKTYQDTVGVMGDTEGTMAIIDMKIQKIEAIKKELRELEN